MKRDKTQARSIGLVVHSAQLFWPLWASIAQGDAEQSLRRAGYEPLTI